MNKKKIAYITGTRADFGLMTPILRAVQKSKKFDLKIYMTGAHLMKELGNTSKEVLKEFPNAKIVPAIFPHSDRGMAEFTGNFITKLTKKLSSDKPDLVLVLGDRVEMLCTAVACTYLGIPIGHIHGGDKSTTVDDSARHAITKLAAIHFPATQEAAQRIRKMGEETKRIHIVGAPALDVILNENFPNRKKLFEQLSLDPNQKLILLTQHPVTENYERAGWQVQKTISAIRDFNLPVIPIYPPPDKGGKRIIDVLEKEKNINPRFRVFPSLPYRQFLALEREVSVWLGNSSAQVIESASFKTPVVLVGNRQDGRLRGKNVINVSYNRKEISKAIHKSLYDKKYLAELSKIKNPWGDGKTGPRVAKILENTIIDSGLLTKQVTY